MPISGVNNSQYLHENLGAIVITFTQEELESIKERVENISIVGIGCVRLLTKASLTIRNQSRFKGWVRIYDRN
ncbi:hypothetical protein CQA44_09255 [Helicobacter sp. MIT 14-3879]|nr:hypothetical protein CQA44_09255 [Helicobacter sp. MIT 14-3879]